MRVPAWMVQTGSCSLEGYVYVLQEALDERGYPKIKFTSYLTPVDQERQERLREIENANSKRLRQMYSKENDE